jgi:two-component system phosphate regulon sensor histidine kinase PhoR
MPLPVVSSGRQFFAMLALLTPTLVVLGFLAVHGEMAWGHVFTAGGAVAVALYFMLRRHIFELTVVVATAEALSDPDRKTRPAPPKLSGGLTSDLLAAVLRLDRVWRERADALHSGIGESRGVFDSLPDPLILLDARRRVTFGNQAARQLLGTIAVGGDLALALRDPAVLEAVDGVLADGVGRQAEFRGVLPNERHFAVRIEKLRPQPAGESPASGGGGAVCVLAMVDVSATKRSEQMRSDFIANASHELRTPLSSLIGFIETLQGPARDDPKAQEQFLKLMHEQAQRMARLVRDLLSLSIIETSEHKPPSGQVDLPALLQTVIDILQLQARAKGMTVKVTVEGALPQVAGDSDQLAQLFQNLIDNAVEAGRQPGRRSRDSADHAGRLGGRQRRRHPRRAYPAPHRALLPRRYGAVAGGWRHRAGPGHRQAYRRPPSRPSAHREPARQGQHFYSFPAAGHPPFRPPLGHFS